MRVARIKLRQLFFNASLAVERATYASKSLIIGLALVMRHLTVEQASLAALVEVNSQIERWGEVEDSKLILLLGHIVRSLTLNLAYSSRCGLS